MSDNPFDGGGPELLDISTHAPGPAGSLPFTETMLRDRPSGDLFGWMEKGELSVRIDSEYPLEAVGEAHAALEGRRTMGKVLIRPR